MNDLKELNEKLSMYHVNNTPTTEVVTIEKELENLQEKYQLERKKILSKYAVHRFEKYIFTTNESPNSYFVLYNKNDDCISIPRESDMFKKFLDEHFKRMKLDYENNIEKIRNEILR